ncbi:MAG: SMI1/KNR4 family protein [Methylovirgula sp.]
MPVEFSDVGALLTDKQLDRLERDIDVKLPAPYRKFLLRTNGGKPHPDFFPIAEHDTLTFGRINSLFGVGRAERQTNVDWHYKMLIGQLPNYALPIAGTVSDDVIFVALGALDEGRIYFWERGDARLEGGYDNSYVIAPNFDVFLEKLYALS